MSLQPSAPVLRHLVEQHAEETLHLLIQRAHLLAASGAPLLALTRVDDRLAAHVDGLRVAGQAGRELADAQADADAVPSVSRFAAAVLALEAGDGPAVERWLARAGARPALDEGAQVALGWVSPTFLRGLVAPWLGSESAHLQEAALVAVAHHGVDAGVRLAALVASADDGVATAAFRSALASGRADLAPAIEARADGAAETVAIEGARAALLLGQRGWALHRLETASGSATDFVAWRLSLMAVDVPDGMARLKRLSQGPERDRLLVQGAGFVGDAALGPWLLQKTADMALSRLAGEALSLIAGIDLADAGLDRPMPPDAPDDGKRDDPANDDTSVPADDSLPWPDPDRLSAWWTEKAGALPTGVRSFHGGPVTPKRCAALLATARLGQRIAAAEHRCLVRPGTPLFNTAAPAWRQLRLLQVAGTA